MIVDALMLDEKILSLLVWSQHTMYSLTTQKKQKGFCVLLDDVTQLKKHKD